MIRSNHDRGLPDAEPTPFYDPRHRGRRSRIVIRAFANDGGRLRTVEGALESATSIVWIDLLNPTADEEAEVERVFSVKVPSREDMEEIEVSSRLYKENGTAFMTAMLTAQTDREDHALGPVSFVLTAAGLVTVRHLDPRVFQTFPVRAAKSALGCASGEGVLLALLEGTIDRIADILERAGRDIEGISRSIFRRPSSKPTQSKDLQSVFESIGRKGDLISDIRDCLVTLERLIGFFNQILMQTANTDDNRERIGTLTRDTHSLADHASFLSQKITFLVDATLGMINIEQNAIIKIFSVAAVVFLPPTLIASIYGMNFAHMPELGWPYGYPLAIGLMIASAVLPYWFFKRRGWL
jgi:magnesium transporter